MLFYFLYGIRAKFTKWFTFTNSLSFSLIIWRALVTARSQDALVGTWFRLMMVVCRLDVFTSTEQGDICTKYKALLSNRWQMLGAEKRAPSATMIGDHPQRCAMSKIVNRPMRWSSQGPSSPQAHWTQPAPQLRHFTTFRALLWCPIPFHLWFPNEWQANLLEEQWSKMSRSPPIQPKHRSLRRNGWRHMHESVDSPLKETFIDRQLQTQEANIRQLFLVTVPEHIFY